ncbi:ProX [Desulforapulum autotrophicum HRM2]|uniref:ProX n=1 Tax=Desulforapulum autotrophicum (strain ATCC 43914 / DSM 3382 / VKM B-1955 / HRM2) TaxID=177437 RepID=C0QAT3_DESAH|nr:ABC transporter substrate-binding protein [Desulforapulum autotrophicum]ACN16866.1 ProX [Desulforapulum autotrophicum HRM2]
MSITSQTRNCMYVLIMGLILTLALPASGLARRIVFADLSWDSVQVHNQIAGFILEHGYDYDVEYMPGETIPLFTGLMRGNVDVNMESWTENIQEVYDKAMKQKKIMDLGSNFPDSWQGWLVPTYMIKGDPSRGIEPVAPDLKSVTDLPRYWELFKDPEEPSKGRFYNSIAGWKVTDINSQKLKAYGLDTYYSDFIPGSDAALSGSMASAHAKGRPWVGYYWGPTWVLGKYDMTPLEEPAFDQKVWDETKGCAMPSVQVNILVNAKFAKKNPEAVAVLKEYETSMALCNELLAYMRDNKAGTQAAALFFLKKHKELWENWVTPEAAGKIEAALNK